MKYVSKTFQVYDEDINSWMENLVSQGYRLFNFKAVGSSSVMIIMEKL
jgi:hypothetical protein